MFWFAFTSIILFIIFLIVLLISTGRSTTDKNLKSLKEELEERNRVLQKKGHGKNESVKREKRKPKPVVEESTPVVEETVAVVEESVPVIEESLPIVEESVAIVEDVFVEEVSTDAVPVEEEATALVTEEPESDTVEPQAEVEEELPAALEPLEDEFFIEEEQPFEEFLEEAEEVSTEEVDEIPSLEVDVEPEIQEEIPEESPVEDLLEEVQEDEVVSSGDDTYDYPAFDNTRTLEEFGLSKEEADDFIVDLIQQIEDEMPGLVAAVEANDSKQIEDISHMIKGSATNLGTGGVADVLVDFNTYMKTASDADVIAKHMKNLDHALKELKEQFQ